MLVPEKKKDAKQKKKVRRRKELEDIKTTNPIPQIMGLTKTSVDQRGGEGENNGVKNEKAGKCTPTSKSHPTP